MYAYIFWRLHNLKALALKQYLAFQFYRLTLSRVTNTIPGFTAQLWLPAGIFDELPTHYSCWGQFVMHVYSTQFTVGWSYLEEKMLLLPCCAELLKDPNSKMSCLNVAL